MGQAIAQPIETILEERQQKGQERQEMDHLLDSDASISTGESSHKSLSSAEHNKWVDQARKRAKSPIWKAKDAAEQAAIKAKAAENKRALQAEK